MNFPLLADYDGRVAKKFGVPTRDGGTIKKIVLGKEHELTRGVSASRWTFVIAEDGKILYKNTAVDAAEDAAKVIEVLKKAR